MFVSRKAPHGLFYQLSMSINYTWEDNSCGTETKIECFIGERRLSISTARYIHLYSICIFNKNVGLYINGKFTVKQT
jgi:hypothetical protein